MKKTYTVVHVDAGHGVEAWFPDFPGLMVPGDRLADTILSAQFALRRHVEHLRRDGLPVPEPTTPDIWAIRDRNPEALIGFAEVATDQTDKEIVEDKALDGGISCDARKSD